MFWFKMAPQHLEENLKAFKLNRSLIMPVLIDVPPQFLQLCQISWVHCLLLEHLLQAELHLIPVG